VVVCTCLFVCVCLCLSSLDIYNYFNYNTFLIDRLPHWKDVDMQELVGHVYDQLGRGAMNRRENKGEVIDDESTAFQPSWIAAFEARNTWSSTKPVQWILTTCDPNGGSTRADTSLISAYYEEGHMIICGLDFHATQRNQKSLLLQSHVKALRENQRFRKSRIIFLPENNMQAECQSLVKVANDLHNVVTWMGEDGKHGAITIAGTKGRYTDIASSFLVHSNVVFDTEMISANPWVPASERITKAKLTLFSQLREWRFVASKSKNPGRVVPGTYSGKTNELGEMISGKKDDATVAFIMNAYFSTLVAMNIEAMFS